MPNLFRDPSIILNITSGEQRTERRTYEVDETVDVSAIKRGHWLTFNASGKLVYPTSATGTRGCVLVLTPGVSGDVSAFSYEDGGVTKNRHIAVATGVFQAEVGTAGYNGAAAYPEATTLKVGTDGKLTPTTAPGDIVTAVVRRGLDSENLLRFTTHGGV